MVVVIYGTTYLVSFQLVLLPDLGDCLACH